MRTLFPRLRSLLLLLTLLTGCGQALPTPEVPQASASQAQQAVYTTPVTPSTKASLEKETELFIVFDEYLPEGEFNYCRSGCNQLIYAKLTKI